MMIPLLTLAGQQWTIQSGSLDGVAIGADGSTIRFRAKSVPGGPYENSVMAGDSPRQLRSELAGQRRYAKGEAITLKGTINVDPATVIKGADWCSLMQIHQADTRRADGSFVASSPMFGAELTLDSAGATTLRVRGETGTGSQPTFSPVRVLGQVPFSFGVDHAFALTVTDGHGGPGRITFTLDGKAVCDFTGPTGYEYVDLFANALKNPDGTVAPQPTGSYLKMGIYAGLNSGDVPPPGVTVATTLSNLGV